MRMIDAIRSSERRIRDQAREIVGRRHVVGVEARRIGEAWCSRGRVRSPSRSCARQRTPCRRARRAPAHGRRRCRTGSAPGAARRSARSARWRGDRWSRPRRCRCARSVICCDRSGLSSRKTSAVITLVMLAIGRLAWPFSCHSTSPVSGLKAMAAAARRSGTSEPDSSVRNRGVIASLSAAAATRTRAASRALAAARARASRALRAFAVDAE